MANDIRDDFVEHDHPQYGGGFFCTPDVFERLTAPVATEQAQAVAEFKGRYAELHFNILHWLRQWERSGVSRLAAVRGALIEMKQIAASPEAAPAAMEGTGPAMQLNATQLRSALELAAPEFDTDEDQREVEVVLQRLPARTSSDGEPMEAGLYCWLAEYPEEGCIPLREDESFPAATPAAPSAVTDERNTFETHLRSLIQGSDLRRHADGEYLAAPVQCHWQGWQARAALAQPAPVQSKMKGGEV